MQGIIQFICDNQDIISIISGIITIISGIGAVISFIQMKRKRRTLNYKQKQSNYVSVGKNRRPICPSNDYDRELILKILKHTINTAEAETRGDQENKKSDKCISNNIEQFSRNKIVITNPPKSSDNIALVCFFGFLSLTVICATICIVIFLLR